MYDLQMPISILNSIKLLWICGDKFAIIIANNPVPRDGMKHVKIDRNFVRHELGEDKIDLNCILTGMQHTDLPTKCLPKHNFGSLVDKFGMMNIYQQIQGNRWRIWFAYW